MEKETLSRLVRQARTGDMEAMSQLLIQSHTPVSYQCRKFMKQSQDAEDMTQEVLLKIYQNLDSLQEPEKFISWVNRIAANLCINQLKRDPRDLQFLEDEEGNSLLDQMEDTDIQAVPDAAVDNAETRQMIADLVDSLPDSQRTTTYLYYFDELSIREIAQLMEVSENTVKSRLNYARKTIRTGVLDYERQGLKLYGMSPLPLLLYFFRREMEAGADTAAARAAVQTVLEQAAAGGAAAAAKTADVPQSDSVADTTARTADPLTQSAADAVGHATGKTALGGLGAKVTAGVLAGAMAIGGLAFLLSGRETAATEESPAPTAAAVPEASPVPTPEPTPAAMAEVPFTMIHTVVDTGRADVVIWLDTPLFEEPSGCCAAINRRFEALRQSYQDGTDPNVSFILSHLGEMPAPVTLTESYTVQSQDSETVNIDAVFSWDCKQPGWSVQSLGYNTHPDHPLRLPKLTQGELELNHSAADDQLVKSFGTADPAQIVQKPDYGSNMMVHYRPYFGIQASSSAG